MSLFQKKTFKRKSIYKALQTTPVNKIVTITIIRLVIGLFIVTGFAQRLVGYAWTKIVGGENTTGTTEIINIMVVGYGGKGHDGGYLADSIAVASYNPTHHTMTMISIPRDLIVMNTSGGLSKINAIMASKYNETLDIHQAATSLKTTVSKVTGLTIPYYTMIDFDGFIQLVDSVGGIDVYVPSHFLDRQYPVDRNGEYEIFELPQGRNSLSGPNTLKYARSRHSTSDFSRSQRQQDIIKAILNKLISTDNISISQIQKIYQSYQKLVITNINISDMLLMINNNLSLPIINSLGLTSECIDGSWKIMKGGCFLRQAQGGLLPGQAGAGEVENYDILHNFIRHITSNPDILTYKIPVYIYNAADPEIIAQAPYGQALAFKHAVKLARYGLNVTSAENAPTIMTGTYLDVYGTGDMSGTISLLQQLLPIDEVRVKDSTISSGGYMSGGLHLYLGQDYLSEVAQQSFDQYTW